LAEYDGKVKSKNKNKIKNKKKVLRLLAQKLEMQCQICFYWHSCLLKHVSDYFCMKDFGEK
jgi:hypothetical protein